MATTPTQQPSDAPTAVLGQPEPPRPPRRAGVATLVTVTGALIIAVMLGQGVLGVVSGIGGGDGRSDQSVAVDGVTAVELDVAASSTSVTFADVDEARLTVTAQGWGANADWRLAVDGDVLKVSDDNRWFAPDWGTRRVTAELVLPLELQGRLDGDFDLGSGDLDITGDYRSVSIDIGAGDATFEGAVSDLDAEISAGTADLTVTDARTLALEVSAGDATLVALGEQPTTTEVSVSAGGATVRLPQGEYALSGSVSAGDRTIEVRTNPSSPSTLDVQVSAGDAEIGYSD